MASKNIWDAIAGAKAKAKAMAKTLANPYAAIKTGFSPTARPPRAALPPASSSSKRPASPSSSPIGGGRPMVSAYQLEKERQAQMRAESAQALNPLLPQLQHGYEPESRAPVDVEQQKKNIDQCAQAFFDDTFTLPHTIPETTKRETEQLLSHFMVCESPNALRDALRASPGQDVALRVAADGTTRARIEVVTPTAVKMSDTHKHLKPKERDSLFVTDSVLDYIKVLPAGTRVFVAKLDIVRIAAELDLQLEDAICCVPDEEVDQAKVQRFATFVEDMRMTDWDPEKSTMKFVVPESLWSADRVAAIRKCWDGLFRNMRPPRHERWSTYGSAARRVALHDALMFFDMLFAKSKPWNMTPEEYAACIEGADRQESFQLTNYGGAQAVADSRRLFQPLDALSAEFLEAKPVHMQNENLREKAEKEFNQAREKVLRNFLPSANVVTLDSTRISDAEKIIFSDAARNALTTAFASFCYRISSGTRDELRSAHRGMCHIDAKENKQSFRVQRRHAAEYLDYGTSDDSDCEDALPPQPPPKRPANWYNLLQKDNKIKPGDTVDRAYEQFYRAEAAKEQHTGGEETADHELL
eukprot:g10273.t1